MLLGWDHMRDYNEFPSNFIHPIPFIYLYLDSLPQTCGIRKQRPQKSGFPNLKCTVEVLENICREIGHRLSFVCNPLF